MAGGEDDQGAHGRHLYLSFGTLMLGMLLASLDQNIVSTALPTIAGNLGGLDRLSWVVSAYLFAMTASGPLWGKLGDQYGRKPFFVASIAVFLTGSAVCGLAQSMGGLIAARAFQGVGAGGVVVLALAIVGDLVPPRRRGRLQGLFGGVFGLATIVGPTLGGFFVDHLSWRWVFYVNLPIGVLALVVVVLVLRPPERRHRHRIDYLGTLVLAGAAACLVLLATWGGVRYPWPSPQIGGLAAAAAVLVAVWIRVERRAAEPVLPLRMFRSTAFALISAIAFAFGFAMFAALVFVPILLQLVYGISPTMSGVRLLPLVVALAAASIVSGHLITRTGRYRIFPVAGTALVTVALLVLSRVDEHTSALTMSAEFAVLGLGLGLTVQVLVITAQNAVDYTDLGAATSGVTFFRTSGGAFGAAILGAVLSTRLAHHVDEIARTVPLPPGFNPIAVRLDPAMLRRLPPADAAALVHAFARALDDVFLRAVPVAAVALVLTCFLPERPLRRTAMALPDLGRCVGGVHAQSSLTEIERALSELADGELRRDLYRRLVDESGLDLTPAGSWIVARLCRHGPLTRYELAAQAAVAPGAEHPHVDRLIEHGYVTEHEDMIALTEAGGGAAERLFAVHRAALADLVADWSPQDHPELAELLDRHGGGYLGDDADRATLVRG